MNVVLFPRLDRLAVDALLASRMGPDLLHEPQPDPFTFPVETTYGASGGSPVHPQFLAELRSRLIDIARGCGFPDRGRTADRARFDELASIYLAQLTELNGGEALRDDVWAFLTCVILPDIAAWRFVDRPAERFHGGVRNTFQRLWMRGRVLDRGSSAEHRWELLRELTEDALVQITERPSVGNDSRLARALAEGWLRASRQPGRSAMEDAMREAIVRLRLRNQVQLLSELDDEQLHDAIDSFFLQSIPAREANRRSWADRLLNRIMPERDRSS